MTTGTGLVLLGVWSIVAAAFMSRNTGSTGVWIALFVAIGMTVYLK